MWVQGHREDGWQGNKVLDKRLYCCFAAYAQFHGGRFRVRVGLVYGESSHNEILGIAEGEYGCNGVMADAVADEQAIGGTVQMTHDSRVSGGDDKIAAAGDEGEQVQTSAASHADGRREPDGRCRD